MKILIVDDNETNIYLLEVLLKGKKHECISAKNGEDALKKLESNPVDLIVSDTLMPVMDGFQLCHTVKSDERFSHIPFIFYSGTYREKEDVELARRLGAAKYLVKPMEPAELLEEIQTVIKEVGEGKHGTPQFSLPEEKEVYRLYSERLINKLEEKMSDLEREVGGRKQIEDDFVDTLHSLKKIILDKNHDMEVLAQELKTPVDSIKTEVDAMKKINKDHSLDSHFQNIENEIAKSVQIITVFLKKLS